MNKAKKLKQTLEKRGFNDVKVWWEPIGKALEMCGPSGGWLYSHSECDEDFLGYNFGRALSAAKNMEPYQNIFCICGHKDSSHSKKIGCEVFLNEYLGDCPCERFVRDWQHE